jgi:hypothetical protein
MQTHYPILADLSQGTSSLVNGWTTIGNVNDEDEKKVETPVRQEPAKNPPRTRQEPGRVVIAITG